MRVIAGKARRSLLIAPKGVTTRPTSDRAKETLFNILAERLHGVRFLDLFCGSGAVGIEALSRGASEAVFVDNSRAAQQATAINLEKTRLNGEPAEIFGMTATKAIQRLADEERRFEIIFLDPPYDMRGTDFLLRTLHELGAVEILADGGIIVAETDTRTGAAFNDDALPFVRVDKRDCGQTCFLFYGGAI